MCIAASILPQIPRISRVPSFAYTCLSLWNVLKQSVSRYGRDQNHVVAVRAKRNSQLCTNRTRRAFPLCRCPHRHVSRISPHFSTRVACMKPAVVAVVAVSMCGGFDRLHPTKTIPLAHSIECGDITSLEQDFTSAPGSNLNAIGYGRLSPITSWRLQSRRIASHKLAVRQPNR